MFFFSDRHTQSAEMLKERISLEDLLSTMTLGNLLPDPLSHMLELAPELTTGEVSGYLILIKCIPFFSQCPNDKRQTHKYKQLFSPHHRKLLISI